MTKEKKQLLLQDLCARLPYGVKLRYIEDLVVKKESHIITLNNIYLEHIINGDTDIKPYLRPMSSMTEEEDKEYAKVIVKSQDCSLENSESATTMVNDWLLSKGFDVRGLISRGLALEAPKDMYIIKTE